ncbi:Hypothetical protein PBC10988_10070 [Planctomycetales bacterium 10988]|nr:Hypothetical protein PBC10988_10070 [Planctomycetales bacterium 10988]
MAGKLLTDELWTEIGPLFPTYRRSRKGGRPPVDNRTVFTCVLFLCKTGIGWRELPTELGASEKTVRRRLNEWKALGLFEAIAHRLLTRLRAAGGLDLAEVLIDGGLVKAPCGGENAAPTRPTEAAVAAN